MHPLYLSFYDSGFGSCRPRKRLNLQKRPPYLPAVAFSGRGLGSGIPWNQSFYDFQDIQKYGSRGWWLLDSKLNWFCYQIAGMPVRQ
jgi:hypothetical protein